MKRMAAATLGLAATLAVALGAAPALAGSGTGGLRPRLPAPSGTRPVGTVALHLVDRSRPDPWVPSIGYRELMVSLFYPAASVDGYPLAPLMLPKAAAHFDAVDADQYLGLGLPTGVVDWAGVRTGAHQGAPVDSHAGPLPVLLYSPGLGEPRTWSTTLVEDLASRGYLVVTIDNTYESPEVEFPDGRLALLSDPQPTPAWVTRLIDTRVADTRFVLDQLTALRAGADPDADGARLPRGLAGSPDLRSVGMFGHSAGGFAAAEAMYSDPRIRAGVNLDGTMSLDPRDASVLSPVAANGLDRPFLLVGSDGGESRLNDPSWLSFWGHSRGWHADLTLLGSRHASFTDAETLIPQIAAATGLDAQVVTDDVGALAPRRATEVQDTYLAAFFDRFLRHRDDHLLDGPSARYPEMVFVR